MFLDLPHAHETSKLFYARHLAFFGSRFDTLMAIAILKKMAAKGNLVARMFLQVAIFKLMWRTEDFCPCPAPQQTYFLHIMV